MFMDAGMDTGDIIDTITTPIGENETAGELFDRLAPLGAELLSRTLRSIADGTVQRAPQNNAEATMAPMLEKAMGKLDFTRSAKELHDQGCVVHSVVGFRNKDLLILEDEFNACSDELRIMTDDGSYGTKGVVTAALDELVAAGNQYDLVITIGPLIMMKFVVKTCQKHGLKSIVSMNPIMIDGTGMCGGCRLTVGGETKFACVDGPDFDGDLVDFDEAMARGTMYRPFEAKAREKACNLFKTQEGM